MIDIISRVVVEILSFKDGQAHRGHAADTAGNARLAVFRRLLFQLGLLLVLVAVPAVGGLGVGDHGRQQHDACLRVDGKDSVHCLRYVRNGGLGGRAGVVHTEGDHKEVTAVGLGRVLDIPIEILRAVPSTPTADGCIEVGDGPPRARYVVALGDLGGDGGCGDARGLITDGVAVPFGQGAGKEDGVGVRAGGRVVHPACGSTVGDGVAVEEHSDVLSLLELLEEGMEIRGLAGLTEALPGGGVGVGDADLPVVHGAVFAPVGHDLLAVVLGLEDGVGVVVKDLVGNAGDGRVGGHLQIAVHHSVVLPFLVGHGAVVGGDRDHLLDGVEQGLYVSLFQEHDGLVYGQFSVKDGEQGLFRGRAVWLKSIHIRFSLARYTI